MVAKDDFLFATVTDGFKEVKLVFFSHENCIFGHTFHKRIYNFFLFIGNSIRITSSQPPVTVAKGKISLAKMTHNCNVVIIDKIRLTFKNLDLSLNLAT